MILQAKQTRNMEGEDLSAVVAHLEQRLNSLEFIVRGSETSVVQNANLVDAVQRLNTELQSFQKSDSVTQEFLKKCECVH